MRIILLGCTKYTEHLFNVLLEEEFNIVGVFTIPKTFTVRGNEEVVNSNYADLKPITDRHEIPLFTVNQGQTIKDYKSEIDELKPDLILVLGWYYIVPKSIRDIPTYGACGIHASLLPKYAGWSPLVWAMIKGEKETGVTFFQFDESVDGGDIIAQDSFLINFEDDIADVYSKATEKSADILRKTLPLLHKIEFKKQNKALLEIYDKRTPEDGELDLNKSAFEMYNFIRAQNSPYPGAFIRTVDGKKLIIEKARIEE